MAGLTGGGGRTRTTSIGAISRPRQPTNSGGVVAKNTVRPKQASIPFSMPSFAAPPAAAPAVAAATAAPAQQQTSVPIGGLPQMQDWINKQHENATLEANVNAVQTADAGEGLRKRLEQERRVSGGTMTAGDTARVNSQIARQTAQNQNVLTLGRERDISSNKQFQGNYGLALGGLANTQQNTANQMAQFNAAQANQMNQYNRDYYLRQMEMMRNMSQPQYSQFPNQFGV